MVDKTDCLKATRAIRSRFGVEATDEQLIAALHLMNAHGADISRALDQSARSGNDHGVDAWFYDEDRKSLHVY